MAAVGKHVQIFITKKGNKLNIPFSFLSKWVYKMHKIEKSGGHI